MKVSDSGRYGLMYTLLCTLLLCGCRMFNVGSMGPVDVVLREEGAESVWQPLTENCQGTELLLSCREAVPNCLLEGGWPESLSSSEIKIAVEELVDLYWRCNYFEFVRKGQAVKRPVVVCKHCTGLYDTRVRISREAVAGHGRGAEGMPVLPFQPGFATFTIYKDKPLVVDNPVIASLEDVLALICENCGMRYYLKDGKIVICPLRMGNDSHHGNEYEDLAKMLIANSLKRGVPYEKNFVSWWSVFDKLRQEEYDDSRRLVVHPLGMHSRDKVEKNAKNIPRGQLVKQLKISLGNDRKSVLYTCRGREWILCTIDASAYAVLNVKMENIETGQERISVNQLPPSIDLFKSCIPEGEMLLVFTPQGLLARPWYSRQFNYYCCSREESDGVK